MNRTMRVALAVLFVKYCVSSNLARAGLVAWRNGSVRAQRRGIGVLFHEATSSQL